MCAPGCSGWPLFALVCWFILRDIYFLETASVFEAGVLKQIWGCLLSEKKQI